MNKLQRLADITETRKKGMTNYECDKDEEAMLINCAIVEHERWIASHKLMGYLFNENKDYVKKYHNCIVPWELLSEETKSYDCNVVDTTIRMAYKKIRRQTKCCICRLMSGCPDSNWRPQRPERCTLPTALHPECLPFGFAVQR